MNKSALSDAVSALDDELIIAAAETSPKKSLRPVFTVALCAAVLALVAVPTVLYLSEKAPQPPVITSDPVITPEPDWPEWVHFDTEPQTDRIAVVLGAANVVQRDEYENCRSSWPFQTWHGLQVTQDLYDRLLSDEAEIGFSVYSKRVGVVPVFEDFVFEGRTVPQVRKEINRDRLLFYALVYALDLKEHEKEYTREDFRLKLNSLFEETEEIRDAFDAYRLDNAQDETDLDWELMQKDLERIRQRLENNDFWMEDARSAYIQTIPDEPYTNVFQELGSFAEANGIAVDGYMNLSIEPILVMSRGEFEAFADLLAETGIADRYFFTGVYRVAPETSLDDTNTNTR